ncbi:MAG: hypothetical protein ABJA02_14870 [Acidobacteriota bacterium]
MLTRLVFAIILSTIFAFGVVGQKLPDRVRGYKSYNLPAVAEARDGRIGDKNSLLVKTFRPQIDSIGLNGFAFDVLAEISGIGRTGQVDFLTFRDFRLNGVRIEIAEYNHTFSFKDREAVALPSPLKVLIPSTSLAKTAIKELIGSKPKWSVSGTVLVFGRFNKLGFRFKRVVAVPVEIEIDNPLAELTVE